MMQWVVIGYPEMGSFDGDKRLMVCKTKKKAVGAVGIMLDQFNMKHVDVFRDDMNDRKV
jgi:hypothetical protein